MRRAPAPYRWLLRLHPRRFREAFGAEMEDTFAAHLSAARSRGNALAVVGVWARGVRDVVAGALRERWREGIGDWTGDVKYAVRALWRRPALTLSAGVTLALGIGATSAMFSIVNGLLFRPFGYEDEAALVQIRGEHPERGWHDVDVTLPDVVAWRARDDAFDDVAAFTAVGLTDTSGDLPERLDGVWHTTNLMSLLGVEPQFGRDFTPADGVAGAPATVVVSHGYWVRSLGADPQALGSDIVLNGRPRTIVGVMPAGFRFMESRVDVFVPWQGDPAQAPLDEHAWQSIARLADGTTLGAATVAAREVSARMAVEHPDSHEGFTASLVSIRTELLGDMAERAAVVLLAAVGFVLLMACVNVANLLLSRAVDRSGEMAVRSAMGASRGRLVRQLGVEAGALALVGAGAGAAVAWYGRRLMIAGMPSNLPPVFTFDIDARVLFFTASVVTAATLSFGLLPALRTARLGGDLRRAGRGTMSEGRAAGALVVVQTALAVVLLVGGVVMARGVVALRSQDMGWSADAVLSMRISPRTADYPTGPEVEVFYRRVLTAVRALPGVAAAGAVQSMPLQGQNFVGSIRLTGREAGTEEVPVRITRLGPGYLEALDLEMKAGRAVGSADRSDTEPVALVNEAFVKRYLGHEGRSGAEAVIGATFTGPGHDVTTRIVGVVEDHIERAVERPAEPSIYIPLAQQPVWTRTLVVRASGDAAALAPAMRSTVAAVDPTIATFDIRTLRDRIDERMGSFDLAARLMGAFALLSLMLGAVGIYGVTARAVARRAREIGLRLALGAEPSGVARAIALRALRRVFVGLLAGLALAVPLSGTLQRVAVGTDVRSPSSFLSVVAILVVVGGLGAWLPARRVSRIDPVRALAGE